MKKIAFSHLKGGCGKSSLAICIAGLLAESSDVVLLDSDRNESCLYWASRGKLPFPVVAPDDLQPLLRQRQLANTSPEYLIIDSPSNLSMGDLLDLIDGADLTIFPTSPEGLVVNALARTWSELPDSAKAKSWILVNANHPISQKGRTLKADLRRVGVNVLAPVVRQYAAMGVAAEKRCLPWKIRRSQALREDIELALKAIIKKLA